MHWMSRQNANIWHRKEKGFTDEDAVVVLDICQVLKYLRSMRCRLCSRDNKRVLLGAIRITKWMHPMKQIIADRRHRAVIKNKYVT